MLDGYTFAPLQSIVMGAFIAITDVLLLPGQKDGLESVIMYLVQVVMLYIVFQIQGGGAPLCGIGPRRSGPEIDWATLFVKTMIGTMVLWVTDLILRPANIQTLWLNGIKFIIQGSIMWHVFNYDSKDEPSSDPSGKYYRYR